MEFLWIVLNEWLQSIQIILQYCATVIRNVVTCQKQETLSKVLRDRLKADRLWYEIIWMKPLYYRHTDIWLVALQNPCIGFSRNQHSLETWQIQDSLDYCPLLINDNQYRSILWHWFEITHTLIKYFWVLTLLINQQWSTVGNDRGSPENGVMDATKHIISPVHSQRVPLFKLNAQRMTFTFS